jgi:hypothetical protein
MGGDSEQPATEQLIGAFRNRFPLLDRIAGEFGNEGRREQIPWFFGFLVAAANNRNPGGRGDGSCSPCLGFSFAIGAGDADAAGPVPRSFNTYSEFGLGAPLGLALFPTAPARVAGFIVNSGFAELLKQEAGIRGGGRATA